MKLVWKLIGVAGALVGTVAAWNYFSVSGPVASRLEEDPRNETVSLLAYHQYGLVPSVLVIDLRGVSEKAAAVDVLRALFQSAEALKDSKFDRVVLSYKGTSKLMLEGAYFQQLGVEFKTQNPVYTMRMLPQNVHRLDGAAAYGTWTGGWLGVVGRQMEDLGKFSQDWYLQDMAKEAQR